MRKLLFLVSLVALKSCNVLKEFDTKGFTIEGNTVSYNNVPMLELDCLVFVYDNLKLLKERTFKVLETADNNKINNLTSFLHAKHPEY